MYISAPEAFALAHAVEEMQSAEQKREVLDRLRVNVEATAPLNLDQHIATNIRCAFLSDVGQCLAYELRPGACRHHHALSVEPCRVTFEDPTSTMKNTQLVEVLRVSSAFMTASQMAVTEIKADDWQYELHGAVLEALTNNASTKRWRDGKSSFPSVRDKIKL